jgi:membrane protease YdiL (CAAX protease family)/predicted negative regulator of RcsB-dependent stress response
MKNILFILLLSFFVPNALLAQELKVSDENSHEIFVKQLNASKELKYTEILKKYDDYIISYPDSIRVRVSKCRFIGAAYYDEYEGYDLNWELTVTCLDELYLAYPENPDVIIFKLERLYGDEQMDFIKKAIKLYNNDSRHWTKQNAALLFQAAAITMEDTDSSKSLNYAKKAVEFDDSLDLSILLSRLYKSKGKTDKAKEVLEAKLSNETNPWILSQKGDLLIELNEFEKALEVFERVKSLDSTIVDNSSLYKISINGGQIEKARSYLIQDTIHNWSKVESLQRLLKHDMSYSSAEIVLTSYKRLQEESYYDDFFGVKQFQMLLKNPFHSFSLVGFSHFLVLLLFLTLLFLVPYIWIMPVYSIGKYFRLKFDFDRFWNLKHFWFISFAYLLIQTTMVLVFYYQESINYYFDLTGVFYTGEDDEIANPNEIMFFSILLLISTLILLNKQRLTFAFKTNWPIKKIIGTTFVFIVFNMFLLRVLDSFADLTDVSSYFSILNMKQEISLLLNEKGIFLTILIVAIFAPFYEEIIFRGIILNSAARHIGFIPANIFQSVLFALIHFNLALFPFYFIFGLITGTVAKRSKGLLTGIIYHSINNLIVVLALYSLARQLAI